MASAKDVMLSMDSDAEGKHCAWSMDKNLMKFYISIASTAKKKH